VLWQEMQPRQGRAHHGPCPPCTMRCSRKWQKSFCSAATTQRADRSLRPHRTFGDIGGGLCAWSPGHGANIPSTSPALRCHCTSPASLHCASLSTSHARRPSRLCIASSTRAQHGILPPHHFTSPFLTRNGLGFLLQYLR
jgi:hypothetical protein